MVSDVEQGSRTDLAVDGGPMCWRSSSDLQLPTAVPLDQALQVHLSKVIAQKRFDLIYRLL